MILARSRKPAWPVLAAGLAGLAAACGAPADQAEDETAPAQESLSMQLTSTVIAAGQPIPREFTCEGANTSPPLQWSDPPEGTKSFALLLEDPDAPGGLFRHWGVYDLPADQRELTTGAGAASDIAQVENDFGEPGYAGPCPPPGDQAHHYRFRLLALDVDTLGEAPTGVEAIADAADGHVLASAELVALYSR